MEMTIDNTIDFFNGLECHTPQAKDARDVAIDTMRKYQQLQADYEARLKADLKANLKAILVELQLKIEEIKIDCPNGFEPVSKTSAFYDGVLASSKVVQQKINELKAESEPHESDDNDAERTYLGRGVKIYKEEVGDIY